jgi:hypothetical protein
MKLYATTTSERATKGQGGNDYLDIKITFDDNGIIKPLKAFKITLNENGFPIIRGYPLELEQKGEKQKGGNCWRCNENGTGSDNKYCGTCSGFGVIQ